MSTDDKRKNVAEFDPKFQFSVVMIMVKSAAVVLFFIEVDSALKDRIKTSFVVKGGYGSAN